MREAGDLTAAPDKFDVSDEDMDAAAIWDAADVAALDAACAGWDEDGRRRPQSARLQLVTKPSTQLVDRDTALATLRSRVDKINGQAEFHDESIANLAWIVAADLEDPWRAQQLVDDLTVAFTALEIAGFDPDVSIELKRHAALVAVDALEQATK